MEKKQQYIVIGVIAIIAVAGIVGGIAVYANMPKGGTFIYGTMYGPRDLDLQDAWDSASTDVIFQVCEGLFDYNYDDPDFPIVPHLATGYSWSADGLELTCTLRQGVKFHDGTDFNAEAVKWNFDRLYNMLDSLKTAELYVLPTGEDIVASVDVVDDYTVKFTLNDGYAPFLGLLCFTASYIMSPTSTPEDEVIDTATGDLVGTGPFIYDSYESEIEVTMSPNPDYWGGAPAVDSLIISVITDSDARNSALLTGDVNYLSAPDTQFYDVIRQDANTNLIEGPPSMTIQYLGFNNKQIPQPMRKALSYALDYDYVIAEVMDAEAIRMRSHLPRDMLYADWESYDLAVFDLTIARQTLIDSGLYEDLPAVDDDAAWEDLAVNNPVATYNYTYNVGNRVREDMLIVCQDNFAEIGVKVTDAGMTWSEFISRGYELGGLHRDMLQLFFIGWIPDYNDPSTYTNPLFTNKAIASNMAQVDNDELQTLMEAALGELDPVQRAAMYGEIQQILIEEIYPWAYCYVAKDYDAMSANVRGYKLNPFYRVFRYIYFV